jgi:hypothetical protein
MKIASAALLLAASLAVPATAHADCGQDGQPACTGPVPTVDQVMDIMNRLTDPNVPAIEKGDIVTPPFDEHQAQRFDVVLHYLGHILPINFTVTDIQPAPNNFAGATVSNPPSWSEHSGTGPIVLVLQDKHWMITHDSATSRVDQLSRGVHAHTFSLGFAS